LTRNIKPFLLLLSLALVVCGSFAAGRRLRQVVAHTNFPNARVTALPESGIGARADEGLTAAQLNDSSPAETFLEVLKYIKSDYVERITDEKKLGFGAVRTMLASLDDPKTRFVEPEQRKQLEEQINGHFRGIGAVVTVVKQKRGEIEQRRLAVVAPAPGSPADKGGIRAGDIITEIDGRWVIAYDPRKDLDRMRVRELTDEQYRKAFKEATQRLMDGLTLPKALELLNTNREKPLALTIERPGVSTPIKVRISTASVMVDPVEFKALNSRVGYLRVTQFNDRATQLFTEALASAEQPAFIVDLRDNAGGPVDSSMHGVYGSARALLGHFTSAGPVGMILRRGNRRDPIVAASSRSAGRKLVVLINRGTANVAEFVAAALKEKANAILIGTPTFGDSILQKLIPLQSGAAMTVTAGKFLTASGMDFTGKGLTPDVAVATNGVRSSNDPAIQRALSVLSGA
jgi:carboxyl-terminal processing protease